MKSERVTGSLFLYAAFVFFIQPVINSGYSSLPEILWVISSGIIFCLAGVGFFRNSYNINSALSLEIVNIFMILLCIVLTVSTVAMAI